VRRRGGIRIGGIHEGLSAYATKFGSRRPTAVANGLVKRLRVSIREAGRARLERKVIRSRQLPFPRVLVDSEHSDSLPPVQQLSRLVRTFTLPIQRAPRIVVASRRLQGLAAPQPHPIEYAQRVAVQYRRANFSDVLHSHEPVARLVHRAEPRDVGTVLDGVGHGVDELQVVRSKGLLNRRVARLDPVSV